MSKWYSLKPKGHQVYRKYTRETPNQIKKRGKKNSWKLEVENQS